MDISVNMITQDISLESVLNEVDLSDDSNDQYNGIPPTYTELIASAVSPIIKRAQLDMASKIAMKYNLDENEVKAMCLPNTSANEIDGVGSSELKLVQNMGEKRKVPSKETLGQRRNSKSKRPSKQDSFQIVKKLLDGTDQALKNLLDVDEANDRLVGKSGSAGTVANSELKQALSGADQTLVELAKNIKHLAGILRAVYPPHVVEKMSSDLGDIADHHPSVSVLMCDIVGFTDWCSHTPPNRVIECLSAYFQILDDLAEKCGIYKVETIGDGYQAICGHDNNTPDHADRMARFALLTVDLVPLMQRIFKTEKFNIRLGIHSGPIVTGVIRADRPRWQLFGDTVNVASRMESTDEPGRVQISKQTYDLLLMSDNYGKTFTIERRGMMHIKGKGEFETYFLVNLAPQNKEIEGSLVEHLGMDGSILSRQPSQADENDTVAASTSNNTVSLHQKGTSVLLIDDMLSILLQLTRIMQKEKIKVTTARNGEDALEILCRESFNVVFCDIHMPGITGLDVVRKFREWEKGNRRYRQRMYALTGDVYAGESYLEAGFDGTVSKNSNKEEILSFVYKSLGDYHSYDLRYQ